MRDLLLQRIRALHMDLSLIFVELNFEPLYALYSYLGIICHVEISPQMYAVRMTALVLRAKNYYVAL